MAQGVPVAPVRPRVDSLDRWYKALDRALMANLIYIEIIGGDGAYAVSSQRDCERGYIATTHICTCAAGQDDDPVCCHRALVRALVGFLPLDPAPAVIAPAMTDCPDCRGCGVLYDRDLERAGLIYPTCSACRGRGYVCTLPETAFAMEAA